MTLTATDVEVIVVTWNHNHGTDINVVDSWEAAEQVKVDLIHEYMDELDPSVRKRIQEAFDDDDVSGAICIYCDYTEEWFDDTGLHVLTNKTAIDRLGEAINAGDDDD